MSSGYIPAKDEPGPDEIVEALREAVFENPRLRELPAEEVARQLMLDGRLQQEPSPVLVAEMLDALEAEEQGFEADELSEEANPTWVRKVLEPKGKESLRGLISLAARFALPTMESMPENLEALLQSLTCEGLEEDKNSKGIQHSSGQRTRLLLDAKRTEQGYKGADVLVGPSRKEQAYVAAMLALKSEVMERERASKAILYFELMRTRRTDEEARDAVVQAMKELNLYKAEPLYTTDFGDHFNFTHVYELLQYFRPEIDDASEKERIELLERTIGYVNEYLKALRRLTALLQYGKAGAYEGLPTKQVTQAAKQVKAAELRELMRTEQGDPLPYSKIGELIGEKPTPGQARRSYESRIKRMVEAGIEVLKQGLGEQGYREYIEAKRTELQHWQTLREDEQHTIQMEENFGISPGDAGQHDDLSICLAAANWWASEPRPNNTLRVIRWDMNGRRCERSKDADGFKKALGRLWGGGSLTQTLRARWRIVRATKPLL